MAVTATGQFFNSWRTLVANWLTGKDLRFILLDDTIAPNIDNHSFFSSLKTAELATGSGYTKGGIPLAAMTAVQDNVQNRGVFDAQDETWSAATVTARYVAVIERVLASLRSGTYKWLLSGSGTTEYYLEIFAGGDPLISEPNALDLNGIDAPIGTMGSLAAGAWDWGDNDGLGFSTVYARLADGTDPDSKAAGFVSSFDWATDNLVAFWDFGVNQSVSAEDLALVLDATGLFRF